MRQLKDIEFIATAGLRGGVLLPLVPLDCHLADAAVRSRRGIKVCSRPLPMHDLVMNQHSGQGSPDYGSGPVAEALWISEVTFYCQAGYPPSADERRVFERFPRCKLCADRKRLRLGAGAMLAQPRSDPSWAFKHGAIGEMNYEGMSWGLKRLPSEYAAEHCWYGASFPSTADLAGIDQIGEDRVLWGNDYPHYEGTFPYNLESLRLTFADIPDARRRKLLGLNAAALYGFDLDALAPLAARHGPTPAQVNEPLAREDIPRDATCYLFQAALAGAPL